LSTTVQSFTAGGSSGSAESPPPDAGTTASTEGTEEESTSSQSEDATDQPSASSSNAEPSAPASIDPSAGGWSIIVASRADSDGAASLAQTYRERFTDQDVPVDVIERTANNSTRYRVGIGQFNSQSDAQSFLQNHASELPDGAWTLSLQ
jgi:hypothetical protein